MQYWKPGDTVVISNEYKKHMAKEHDGSKWGTTGYRYAGDLVVKAIKDRPYIKTVLDFGCGKGTMKPFLQEALTERELEIYEYDPGIPGKDTLPSGPFDMVLTSDVLEHIEPHLLDETIVQLEKLTRWVLFNDIACSPTGKTFRDGPYAGQDLHLIVEEPIWWRNKFKEVCSLWEAEYQHRERTSNKGPKPRCLLIHERV